MDTWSTKACLEFLEEYFSALTVDKKLCEAVDKFANQGQLQAICKVFNDVKLSKRGKRAHESDEDSDEEQQLPSMSTLGAVESNSGPTVQESTGKKSTTKSSKSTSNKSNKRPRLTDKKLFELWLAKVKADIDENPHNEVVHFNTDFAFKTADELKT